MVGKKFGSASFWMITSALALSAVILTVAIGTIVTVRRNRILDTPGTPATLTTKGPSNTTTQVSNGPTTTAATTSTTTITTTETAAIEVGS